jgi:outer membrane protein
MGIPKSLLFCTIILVLFALWPFTGHGQEIKVKLDEALRIALEENHEVRAFKNTVLAQKENIGAARSFLLPRINFEERAARTNNPPSAFMMKLNQQRFTMDDFALNNLNNPKAVNDFQTVFSFEQPVFLMRSYLNLNIAKLEYSAKNEDYMRKREEITLNIIRAYLRTHTSKGYVKAAETGLEDAREHMRIAEVRYKNGLGLYSDYLRAQTAMIEAEQKNVSTRKDFSVAKKWLGVLLGKSMPIDVVDDNFSLTVREKDHYIDASNTRRDISAMKIRHETIQNNVKLAESSYLPYIGIGGSYQFNDHNRLLGSEGDSWHLMAFLRWELFDGINRESERKKAQFHLAEANERLRGLKEFVAFKVEEAYLAIEEAKKNAELSLAALKSAEEGHKLVKSRYENSLSPIVDLLDVQLNLNRARADAIARENDYKLVIINLSYESGTIMKDLGIE